MRGWRLFKIGLYLSVCVDFSILSSSHLKWFAVIRSFLTMLRIRLRLAGDCAPHHAQKCWTRRIYCLCDTALQNSLTLNHFHAALWPMQVCCLISQDTWDLPEPIQGWSSDRSECAHCRFMPALQVCCWVRRGRQYRVTNIVSQCHKHLVATCPDFTIYTVFYKSNDRCLLCQNTM